MVKPIIQNKKINDLIRKTVLEVLQEVLSDPDFGLELNEWVKKRLRKKPKKLFSFEEIKRKYL